MSGFYVLGSNLRNQLLAFAMVLDTSGTTAALLRLIHTRKERYASLKTVLKPLETCSATLCCCCGEPGPQARGLGSKGFLRTIRTVRHCSVVVQLRTTPLFQSIAACPTLCFLTVLSSRKVSVTLSCAAVGAQDSSKVQIHEFEELVPYIQF